jgi:hypothetical protein
MSRFIDSLKQASQAEHPPMGFGVVKSVSKPRLLVVAMLNQTDVNDPAELVAGADAGMLAIDRLSSGIKVFEEITQAVPDVPWGGWLDSASREEIRHIDRAGFDFLFFPAVKMSLALLEAEKMGKILAIEASLSGGLIKTINELPVDAVFIASQQKEKHPLTWQELLHFQYFATLLAKHLLIPVPLDVAAGELQLLWELGVGGVVVETTSRQPAGGLRGLRQIIDNLTTPSKRRRMKERAIVPPLREEITTVIREEEEEEE